MKTQQLELKLAIATRLTEVFYKRWIEDFWRVDLESYDVAVKRRNYLRSKYLFCSLIAYSEYWKKENSAVLASTPPEPAVENAVVETAQGATYFSTDHYLKSPEFLFNGYSVHAVSVADYSSEHEYIVLLSFSRSKIEGYEFVIQPRQIGGSFDSADSCSRFCDSLSPRSVQLTDSFFDQIPLSAYLDLENELVEV